MRKLIARCLLKLWVKRGFEPEQVTNSFVINQTRASTHTSCGAHRANMYGLEAVHGYEVLSLAVRDMLTITIRLLGIMVMRRARKANDDEARTEDAPNHIQITLRILDINNAMTSIQHEICISPIESAYVPLQQRLGMRFGSCATNEHAGSRISGAGSHYAETRWRTAASVVSGDAYALQSRSWSVRGFPENGGGI
jgi:hypothetical protein